VLAYVNGGEVRVPAYKDLVFPSTSRPRSLATWSKRSSFESWLVELGALLLRRYCASL
jgi:hypothetical protein